MYTFTPRRNTYETLRPAAACGAAASTKTMLQHVAGTESAFCRPSRTPCDVCGGIRSESGKTRRYFAHDCPMAPIGWKRLAPSSSRSQSIRYTFASTSAFVSLETLKPATDGEEGWGWRTISA